MSQVPQRPVHQKGVKPGKSKLDNKDRTHLSRVAELPCVICYHWSLPQASRTQVHHCIHGRHSARKVPDAMIIPLCEGHHLGMFDTSKIAVHREPKRWKILYGTDTDFIHWTRERCSAGGRRV